MIELHRRRALHLLSAGAGMALLAGCSESSDENGADPDDESSDDDSEPAGDLPPYASILPENDQSEYFYGTIDLSTMNALLDGGAEDGDEPTDPLLGNPIVVAFYCSYAISLLGDSDGFDPYLEHNETDDGEETFVYVNNVYAFTGTYSDDGLREALEDAGYETETTEESYAVYTDPDSGEVVGVSDDAFAFTYPNADVPDFDPAAAVERTVATATGQRDPKHETDDDFESFLRAGEADGITLCLYTTDDEFDAETLTNAGQDNDADGLSFAFDAFQGSTGVHQRLSVTEDDVAARGTAVVSYSTDDHVDEARLESGLGTDADSVSLDRDGTTVTIDADYADDVVDG